MSKRKPKPNPAYVRIKGKPVTIADKDSLALIELLEQLFQRPVK